MESLKKKKVVYYCFIILLFVSILPVFSAQSNTYQEGEASCNEGGISIFLNHLNVIKANTTFNIEVHPYNTSTGSVITNASSYCAINVHNPQGQDIYYNGNLSFDTVDFDFQANILGGNFSQLGDYPFVVACFRNVANAGGGECSSHLTVTATGNELTIAQAILNFLFLIASLFIVSFFLYFAITLPFKNPRDFSGIYIGINGGKWMKIVCIVMSYITLMWLFALLYSTSNNYLAIESMSQFFYYFYYVMLSLMWPLIVVTAIVSFIIWLKDMKIAKGLEQHLRMR